MPRITSRVCAREGDSAPPRRLPPRRAAAIRETGRLVVAAGPVVAVVLATQGSSWQARAIAVVQAVIWAASMSIGHSLGGPALTALGPRIAVGRGVLIAVAASAAASAWLPYAHLSLRVTLVLALVVFVTSAIWETFVLRHVAPAVRLLLVGRAADATTLLSDIRRGRGGGYELVGVVADGDQPHEEELAGPRVLGRADELDALINRHRPDLVVLTAGRKSSQALSRILDAAQAGFRVVQLTEFYEYAFGRVPIEDLPHEWFMSVLHLYQRRYSRAIKRALDLAGASLLLLLTLPLFPLLALFVHQTEGPLILRQLRLGEHGEPFTIYKFRTMRADAEALGRAVWATAYDPRLTRTGGIMRRLRLDELPQLWNVFRGEMSLVGPRPERPEFLAELSERVPYWTRRHLIKPGLTGWAQVRQGYAASAEETATKLSYDLWYLRHRSLTVDLAILLRTLLVVFQGERRAPVASAAARRPATVADSYD